MVVTDDAALADTMRGLRNQGRDADWTWRRHVRLDYNYRLDEMSPYADPREPPST
jgi:dTDP-4-amino-4,6-dideoxygalactose transaminase